MNFLKLFILVLLFSSCQSNTSNNSSEKNISPEVTSLLHLLIFKKEKKLELWATGKDSEIIKLKTFESILAEETPIGIFLLNTSKLPQLVLDFPNDVYGAQIGNETFEEVFLVDKITGSTLRESIVMKKESLENLKNIIHPNIKTQVFVFPNDMRVDGTFNACFGCPHQMAELYSSLELHLKQFVN